MLPVVVLRDLASRAATETANSALQDGLVSNWLQNNMRPGKTICFRGVDGDFTLQLTKGIPHSGVLLVGGGIGITPMRAMLAERLVQKQPVTLLYFVRSLREAPFLPEFCQVYTCQAIAQGVAPVSYGVYLCCTFQNYRPICRGKAGGNMKLSSKGN